VSLLISAAKTIGGPGSLRLLVILLLLGLVWMYAWPKRPRSGASLVAIVLAAYLVMALPITADVVVRKLPQAPERSDAEIAEIQTLFIFDGDNRFGRLREFQRIYALAHPSQIFLLGRLSVYKDLLLMDIPRQSLHHDDSSSNTWSQIERVRALLAEAPRGRAFILVSRLQYPRVDSFVRAAGLPVLVTPAPLDDELPASGPGRWLPSLSALAVTRDALYELTALRYYR
jgi:uncharacterized SAM-binding protein YcdF (DUF218 family)